MRKGPGEAGGWKAFIPVPASQQDHLEQGICSGFPRTQQPGEVVTAHRYLQTSCAVVGLSLLACQTDVNSVCVV